MPLTKRAPQTTEPAQGQAGQQGTQLLPNNVATHGIAPGTTPQGATPPAQAQAGTQSTAATEPKRIGGTRKAGDKAEAPMIKDDYWRRREERDVQRDKDMAWSGMAQAVIDSMAIIQLNTTNTLDGLLDLVEKATNSLLERRDRRNS